MGVLGLFVFLHVLMVRNQGFQGCSWGLLSFHRFAEFMFICFVFFKKYIVHFSWVFMLSKFQQKGHLGNFLFYVVKK